MKNPILEELWKAKDEIARECDYDLDKLYKRLRQRQQEGPHKVVDLSDRQIPTGQAGEADCSP